MYREKMKLNNLLRDCAWTYFKNLRDLEGLYFFVRSEEIRAKGLHVQEALRYWVRVGFYGKEWTEAGTLNETK